MHLFFENLFPNMIKLWSGRFKELSAEGGLYAYEIEKDTWIVIGVETEDATLTIPSTFFSSKLPNIQANLGAYKAELMSFWFIFLAPFLLKDRFPDIRMYNHMLSLIAIVKVCLQYELTDEDIDWIETSLAEWVGDYEKYLSITLPHLHILTSFISLRFYYQYDPDKLSACTLMIHNLLHVAPDIRATGPVSSSWAFVMERHCGNLLPAIKSRLNPYGSLDHQNKRLSQLNHLVIQFDLQDKLMNYRPLKNLTRGEIDFQFIEDCEQFHQP